MKIKKKNLLLISFFLTFIFSDMLFAQQNRWSGKIVDAITGEPLIGVNISFNGSGTISDFDGNFNISGSVGDVLTLTYVGYQVKKIKLTGKVDLGVIKLQEDSETLEEVVVVGYGIQKKASSVGAITSTKGDDLLKIGSVATVSEALQGQMPGVTSINSSSKPGEDQASLFIRGKASWNDASPLVLVDGIERNFNDVDVNEIESISVLKDASATAVYGVKGANGVILLTTKRGTENKPVISFSANFGFKQPTTKSEWSDYTTSMRQYNIAQANDNSWNLVPESTMAAWDNAFRTGNYGPYNDMFPNVDWWDEMIADVGYQQNYNLNVRGGTKIMSYFVSLGYLNDGDIYRTTKQEGYDPTFYYKRYNWRSNFDFNITKTTKLSVNIAGKMGYQNQPAFRIDDNGSERYFFSTLLTAPSNEFPIKYSDGTWGDGAAKDQNVMVNVFETGSRSKKMYQGFYDFILKQQLDFITKGLSFKASLSYTNYSNWKSEIIRGKMLGTNDMDAIASTIRVYRKYDYASPIVMPDGSISYPYEEFRYPTDQSVGDLPLAGSYDSFTGYGRKLYYELALNYARKFGNHDVTGLLLFNRKMNETTGGAYMDFPAYEEDWVGRITYGFKDRYLAEVNAAYTGSEKFAPGKRFGFFPSASIGWRISEEPWVKRITRGILSNLKVRYSYGMVGSDKGASRFNYIQTFDQLSANSQFGLYTTTNYGPLFKENKLADPDATWETAVKQNLGIELGLWGKLNLSLDLFDEKRNGILMKRETIPSWGDSGITYPQVNLGKTKNHGLELDLSWNDRIGKFDYYTKFNFSASENRIVFRDDPKNQLDYLKNEGKSIGYVKKYLASGNFQSLDDIYNSAQSNISGGLHNTLIPGDLYFIDFSGDGIIDQNDMVPVDELNYPVTTLGLTLGGNYKGFGFNMLWYSALGVYKEAIGAYLWDFPEKHIKTQPNTLDCWSPEDPISSGPVRPSLHVVNSYNRVESTFTYTNHSYLRLKNIELNYSFPKRMLKSMKLNKLQIYINANNLFTFANIDDRRDPELGGQNVYPIVRRYNIGFRLGL